MIEQTYPSENLPSPCGVGFPTPRGEPLSFDMLRRVSLVEPFSKEGDNNFPLWERENKGDFVNCRSRRLAHQYRQKIVDIG